MNFGLYKLWGILTIWATISLLKTLIHGVRKCDISNFILIGRVVSTLLFADRRTDLTKSNNAFCKSLPELILERRMLLFYSEVKAHLLLDFKLLVYGCRDCLMQRREPNIFYDKFKKVETLSFSHSNDNRKIYILLLIKIVFNKTKITSFKTRKVIIASTWINRQ